MATDNNKICELNLGNDFGPVVIRVNGAVLKIDANGQVQPLNTAIAASEPAPGTLIEGKGIYLGTWEPKDKNGRTLGKIFDIYAAPEDIRNGSGKLLKTFNNAVKHVAGLRNYHGHDGGNFANETAVLEAVRNNPATLEKWFLPTKELLRGKTIGGDKIQAANLYDSRNTGSFKNTFITKSGSGYAQWYWSLTEHPDNPSDVYDVDFSDGFDVWDHKDNYELSSRVVRAELRPKR